MWTKELFTSPHVYKFQIKALARALTHATTHSYQSLLPKLESSNFDHRPILDVVRLLFISPLVLAGLSDGHRKSVTSDHRMSDTSDHWESPTSDNCVSPPSNHCVSDTSKHPVRLSASGARLLTRSSVCDPCSRCRTKSCDSVSSEGGTRPTGPKIPADEPVS